MEGRQNEQDTTFTGLGTIFGLVVGGFLAYQE